MPSSRRSETAEVGGHYDPTRILLVGVRPIFSPLRLSGDRRLMILGPHLQRPRVLRSRK